MSIAISSLVLYVNQVGFRLEGFKQQRQTVWNARCPICGDSEKNRSKRRFYIHADKQKTTLMATCHNCNYSNGFENFIKDHHNDIYQSMIFDLFRRGKDYDKRAKSEVVEIQPELPTDEPTVLKLQMIDSLPEDHPIIKYVNSRRLLKYTFKHLSWCENFKRDICSMIPEYQETDNGMPEDMRLLIPFYDADKNMTFIQARAIDPHSPIRYITLRLDHNAEKWYGVDRLKDDMQTYVIEGPLDSLFIPNCVATADANLLSYPDGDIYIPDNQYRNRSIAIIVERIIESGKGIVLFPEWFTYKDINDAVKANMTLPDLYRVIKENTFYGLKAKLEWSTRSRVSTAAPKRQFVKR